jgi:hypothetical protein
VEVVEQLSGIRAIISVPPPFMQVERALTTLSRKLPAALLGTTNVVPPQWAEVVGIGMVSRM